MNQIRKWSASKQVLSVDNSFPLYFLCLFSFSFFLSFVFRLLFFVLFLPGKLQTQKLRSLLAENPELSKDFFCKSGAGQNIASCDSLATRNFAFLLPAYLHSYYLPVCILMTCLSAFLLPACLHS